MIVQRSTVRGLTRFLVGASLAIACDAKPEPKTADVEVVDKVVTETKTEKVASAPASEEGEEGCIYGEDAHKQEHADGASCDHGDAAPGDDATGHFGAAFTLASSQPLSAALTRESEELVQVSGHVDAVCQKRGCWMVIKDGEVNARIMMKDHAFTVPMKSKGKSVVVEGTLATRTWGEKQVKHLEKDAGGDPSTVSGERKEYVLTATGVEIAPNS